MKVLTKIRIFDVFFYIISFFSFFISVACVFLKAKMFPNYSEESFIILAVKPFLPQGKLVFGNLNYQKSTFYDISHLRQNHALTRQASNKEYSFDEIPPPPSINDSQIEDKHPADEKKYKIIESQFSQAGTKYENFYLKNTAGVDINIAQELTSKLDFQIKKDGTPQVLIYHTHTSESYLKKDEGFFYESYYPRSTDSTINVTRVGEEIAKKLNDSGICTIHDKTYHDSPTYNGSYSRSSRTISDNLSKYPSIKVTIDIHRDSMGTPENGKVKPTCKINGFKTAQVMIIAGCDKDGTLNFPDWRHNLRLALKLQQKCETMFPGLTRPMSFGNFRYNMNLSHGSMLIEVGSDMNTISEAVYAGTLVGTALSEVLNNLT